MPKLNLATLEHVVQLAEDAVHLDKPLYQFKGDLDRLFAEAKADAEKLVEEVETDADKLLHGGGTSTSNALKTTAKPKPSRKPAAKKPATPKA